MRSEAGGETQNGNAWLVVLLAWGCTMLYFDPSLLVMATAAPSAGEAAGVVIWVACLNAFWLYATYYLVMGAAGWREKRHAHFRYLRRIESAGEAISGWGNAEGAQQLTRGAPWVSACQWR